MEVSDEDDWSDGWSEESRAFLDSLKRGDHLNDNFLKGVGHFMTERNEILRSENRRLQSELDALRGEVARLDTTPWKDFHGDLPDYDHPLRCVYESGIQYAVNLLAATLKVDDWEICDGTEEFDGDLGGTLFSIFLAALPTDQHGDPMYPSEIAATIAQLRDRVAALEEGLRPFARLAGPINGEAGRPSYIEAIEGENGTGELYIGSHYGTTNYKTIEAEAFRKARALLTQNEVG